MQRTTPSAPSIYSSVDEPCFPMAQARTNVRAGRLSVLPIVPSRDCTAAGPERSLGLERVVEIVMSDFLSELYPRFSRTAVVQSRPQSCLDDFTPQLLRRIEVAYRA